MADSDGQDVGGRWSAPLTLLVALGCTAGVAVGFWRFWHPRALFYAYNVPIAAPFAAFLLERGLARPRRSRAALALDAVVVLLALLRVFAPPLPYASGHTLFTAYAAATARRWPLRALAGAVLLQVMAMKLFVAPGVVSMIAGLVLAAIASVAATRLARS
jgi:hypothetical protein